MLSQLINHLIFLLKHRNNYVKMGFQIHNPKLSYLSHVAPTTFQDFDFYVQYMVLSFSMVKMT